MRRLFYVLPLLLFFWANTSHALICPDGVSRAASTSLCPANVTSLGVGQITTTSVQVSGQGDVQSRGAFSRAFISLSIYPPGCTSANVTGLTFGTQPYDAAIALCARADLIRAATGASATASETLVDWGYHAKTVSGLAPGTQYYAHVQTYGGGCNPYPNYTVGCTRPSAISLVKTIGFTTAASGGGGGEQTVADGGAAPRYIGNGGNDLNDGLTLAPGNRWASLSKITCSLPAGTNIGILNTSLYTLYAAHFDVCYSSTSNDWAIIGSAKLNGSSVPIWTTDGVNGIGTTDQKVELRGGLSTACLDANTCDFSLAGHQAGGQNGLYDAVITVTGNYVDLRNISLNNWHSNTFHASGPTTFGTNTRHHFIASGVDTYISGAGGGAFTDGYSDFVWKDSTFRYLGLCIQMRNLGNSSASAYGCPAGTLYAGLVSSRNLNSRGLFENNEISNGISETIDIIQGSSHVIIRGNRSYAMVSAGWYADGASDVVTESNIGIGGVDFGWNGQGTLSPGTGQQAMCIADIESWQNDTSRSPTNYMCRNNVQIRPGGCAGIALSDTAIARSRNVGMWYIGNTCLGAAYADIQNWTISTARIQRFHMKSNAIYTPSADLAGFSQSGAQFENSNNHLYAAFTDTDLNGANQTTGDPQLVTSLTTLYAYKAPTWPALTDLRPAVGSPLINSGLDQCNVSDVLVWADFGFGATEMSSFKSGAVTAANWVKPRCYSANDQPLDSSPPKGAMCAAAGC